MDESDKADVRPGMSVLCLCSFGISFCYAIFFYITAIYEMFFFILTFSAASFVLFYYCRKGVRRAYRLAYSFFCLYCALIHLVSAYLFGYYSTAFLVLAVLLAPHMYPIAKQRTTLLLDIFFMAVLSLAFFINIYHTPTKGDMVGNTYHIILTNIGLLLCILELYINIFAQDYVKVSRQKLIAKASEDAALDLLTGLGNRRMLVLHQEDMENAAPEDSPLCVAMADLDFFKKTNDTYGHIAGDNVLRYTAGIMRDTFRKSDLLIRWGGEEFLIFLKHTGIEETTALMEKFRLKMQSSPMLEGKERIKVHLTIGVTEHKPHTSIYDTIARADELMYRGKLTGRNRVIAQAK
jgi:diguanylate cyclase (GGDEF)-like protein